MDGAAQPAASDDGGTASPRTTRTRKKTSRKTRREYRPAAERRHQPKVTDWIPKRQAAVAWFLCGVLVVFLLLGFGGWIARQMEAASPWQSRLSLRGSHSLSLWFSTIVLLVSSLASLQIHALRQHRSSDYRGTYRVWLWFSALLLLASLNCALDLSGMAESFFPARGTSHWWWVWPAFQLSALALIFVRGLLEVRRSPASLAVIALVWIAYSTSLALRSSGVQEQLADHDGFLSAGLQLFGTLALFVGLTLYARQVYMRANGLIKKKSRKKSAAAAEVAPVSEKKAARSGSSRKQKVATVTAADEETESADESTSTSPQVARSATASVESNQRSGQSASAASPSQNRTDRLTGSSQPASSASSQSSKGDVDVSADGDEDSDEDTDSQDQGFRRLSKSERKRLKKLQQQSSARRAA